MVKVPAYNINGYIENFFLFDFYSTGSTKLKLVILDSRQTQTIMKNIRINEMPVFCQLNQLLRDTSQ